MIELICPKCKKKVIFKNYFAWIIRTPFHYFGSRKTKCPYCKEISWMKPIK